MSLRSLDVRCPGRSAERNERAIPVPRAGSRAALALLLAALSACGPDAAPEPAASPPVRDGSLDPSRHVPGDTVLGLRVEAMDVRPDAVDGSGWSGTVRFSGTAVVSGEYRPHPADPEVVETCFFADSASAARLPRFANDARVPWFCLSNREAARADPGAPTAAGPATLEIDEYVYRYEHTDAYNSARLVRVLRR